MADTVLASVLIIFTGPIILFFIAFIRLTSAGPGIYAQVRVGLDGRRFRIYKLRTMAHDCERLSGPRWSTAGDPRVTALGRWLRRTHLDELPQFWNVARGEMSLVGPRPERPEFVGALERAVPGYRGRLRVRPGMTGLAQVQLPPDEDLAGVTRKVACDLLYVVAMGPWLDCRIIAGTAMKVAGVPFHVTRRVLCLPTPQPPKPDEAVPAERDEVVAQLQTA